MQGGGNIGGITYPSTDIDGNSRIVGSSIDIGPYEYDGVLIDSDGDGITDNVDNCSTTPNFDQTDADFDSVGDVCDNCPTVSNSNQIDTDNDGTGDLCEAPNANAGSDQVVFSSITLDGSLSSDPDSDPLTYSWQVTHRDDSNNNKTATGVSPTISNLQPGFYDVILTVKDDGNATDTDTMTFTATGMAYTPAQYDQMVSAKNLTISSMFTQLQLNQAVSDAEAAKDAVIQTKDQTIAGLNASVSAKDTEISGLNETIDTMFTQMQRDQAVSDAEAAKDRVIKTKDQVIATMFTQEQKDEAIHDAVIKFDINDDGKIGMEEAINALQVITNK